MSNTKKGFIAAAILLTGLALSAAVYRLVRPENADLITFSVTKEQRLKPDTVKQEQAGVQALAVQALSDESDEREIGHSGEQAIALLDQYDKFLARAEFSPQARYYLSDVLDRCLPIDVRNQQDLSALRSSGTLPADVMAYLEEKLARCEGIYSRFAPEDDLSARRDAWVQSAADDGLEVAKAHSMLSYPEPSQAGEILPHLYGALRDSYRDPVLRERTLYLIQRYYAIFKDPQIDRTAAYGSSAYRGDARNAWDYLACKHTRNCDLDLFMRRMSGFFYAHDLEVMKSKALEYESAIAEGNWAALDLEPSP